MNHKSLLGTAVAAALLLGAQAASACAISAWSSATGLSLTDTNEPTTAGFARYFGRCSLRVPDSNGATGRYVTDTTPIAETSYRMRVYYMAGDLAAVETDIFQARNTGGTPIIRITHDGSVLRFYTNNGGAAQSVPIVDGRYYSIELAWAASATGSMSGTVTGNSGSAAAPAVAGTFSFPNFNNAADRIDEVRLGLFGATQVPVVAPNFDEFDSRRTTSPGRLCRGDANNSGAISASDRTAVTNELAIPSVVAAGNPDANESGSVSASDRTAITNLLAAFAVCN